MTDTTPETNNSEPTVVVEVPKVRTSIKPIVKKVLFWTGAAVGVLAGAALISNTRRIADALEDGTVTVEPTPDYIVLSEAEALDDNVEAVNDN